VIGIGVVVLTSVGVAGRSGAQALPFCGGQNAAPQPVPYTCTTQTQTIDGSQVFAILHADGQTITVTYHVVAPRSTDAPIRITHHIGISGAGGPRSSASGVIAAGQTEATLSVTTPCVAGQVDIKFVFVLDTQPQGRVGGPWIENGTGCTIATTTTSTTTTSTTTGTTPTTAASTTSSPVATSTTMPPSVSVSRVAPLPSTTLPITGPRHTGTAYQLALLAIVAGSALLVIAGARRVADRGD
jgi:hypothetical protein